MSEEAAVVTWAPRQMTSILLLGFVPTRLLPHANFDWPHATFQWHTDSWKDSGFSRPVFFQWIGLRFDWVGCKSTMRMLGMNGWRLLSINPASLAPFVPHYTRYSLQPGPGDVSFSFVYLALQISTGVDWPTLTSRLVVGQWISYLPSISWRIRPSTIFTYLLSSTCLATLARNLCIFHAWAASRRRFPINSEKFGKTIWFDLF